MAYKCHGKCDSTETVHGFPILVEFGIVALYEVFLILKTGLAHPE